jgi:uncharacterized protein (DUF433 family)
MEAVLDKYLEITPGIRSGRPRIAGQRITVDDVVVMHLRLGQSLDEIAAGYELSLASVYTAMAYYFDHKQDVDRKIDNDDDAYVEAMRSSQPSKLQAKLRTLRGE